MKAFETAEQSRLHHTERALKQFCQYERELLETKLNLLNHLEVLPFSSSSLGCLSQVSPPSLERCGGEDQHL
jgi:hypothetical protein